MENKSYSLEDGLYKEVYCLQKKKKNEGEKLPCNLKDVFNSLGYHYIPVPTASYDSAKTHIFFGNNNMMGYVGLVVETHDWALELGIITKKQRTPVQKRAIEQLVSRLSIS